jgi:hypothetical protein
MRHETRHHARRHTGHSMIAALVLALLLPAAWSRADAAEAHGSQSGGGLLTLETPAPTGRIVVNFTESSALAVAQGALTPASADASRLQALLAARADAFTLERHFTRDARTLDAERLAAERNSGQALPNLNRYARLVPRRDVTRAELLDIVRALRADPAVETAFLEPVAVPAALGFDAFTGTFDAPAAAPAALRTLDFTGQQGYLNPAPLGVNAIGAWVIPGGTGQTVKVIDIEGACSSIRKMSPALRFAAAVLIASATERPATEQPPTATS